MWVGLLLASAGARPYTSVGFTAADVIEVADSASGAVRAHYAVQGPSAVDPTDQDGDGLPDFVQDVLQTADASLALFADLGLRPVVRESEFGEVRGGSDATDAYIIDFPPGADGAWHGDLCDEAGCSGYLLVDNQFLPYPHPSVGVATVVPHELFHAVQRAYVRDLPTWFSEGTATWAGHLYQPGSTDFIVRANRYLADASRPIDRPPTGPVQPFAYGSCLFFDFLTLRHDPELMAEIFELASVDMLGNPNADLMATVGAALQARGDDPGDAFLDFARYNLATGSRAGDFTTYPYAARLSPPPAAVTAPFLDIEPRYFPWAMVFHRLDHPGGPAAMWWEADAPALRVELYHAPAGAIDQAVWSGTATGEVLQLGDLPAGIYWMLGTVAERAPESIKLRACVGEAAQVEDCAVPLLSDTDPPADDEPGCGCQATPLTATTPWLLLAGLALRRRSPSPVPHVVRARTRLR